MASVLGFPEKAVGARTTDLGCCMGRGQAKCNLVSCHSLLTDASETLTLVAPAQVAVAT